jgi:hypothetical protein
MSADEFSREPQGALTLSLPLCPELTACGALSRAPTVKGTTVMRALLLSIAAATAALASFAEARTINLGDIIAQGGGAVRGAQITVIEPEPVDTLSRGEVRDRALSRCMESRGAPCLLARESRAVAGETMLAITLDEGFSLSGLSFSDSFAPGAISRRNPSVIVNGISYTLSELSGLSLSSRRVIIDLDSFAAAGVTLRSFELSALATPLPAAGFLMFAGLGGIAVARSLRKKS